MLFSPAQILAVAVEFGLMIVLPLVVVRLWIRRRRVPLAVPLIAAAFYLLNLVVNVPLTALLYPSLGLPPVTLTALTALTYGLCEEVARWLSFKVGPLARRRDGDGGVAAGLGYGGMESLLFAAPYAIGTVVALVSPAMLPIGTREALAGASPWLFVGTGLDRLPALAGHLVFALLIVLAHQRGLWFLWIAIAGHAALDFGMFLLRDHAPTPVFIGVWTLVGMLALMLAVRLWQGLTGVDASRSVGPARPADPALSALDRR